MSKLDTFFLERIIRSIINFSELITTQRELYKENIQNQYFIEDYYNIILKEISIVCSAITKLASNCILINLKSGLVRDILIFLTN